MRVLVTGGAGYIGSVVVEQLLLHGDTPVVYDNLSKGHREQVPESVQFIQGDLLDRALIEDVLRENRVNAVIHMAAHSIVPEAYSNPAKYYFNNVSGSLALLEAMQAAGVPRIVLSSTAAVYGAHQKQPLLETSTTAPENPYGETKLVVERALRWYEQAYGLRHVSLRYFNAAGATENCGELHEPETHLIPIALQVANRDREYLEIFGDDFPTPDGTCIRDYIHVSDVASAHVLALPWLEKRSGIFNVGTGTGHSVLEIVESVRRVTGRPIPVRIGQRRLGDPPILIASSQNLQEELNWKPLRTDLDVIVESAWSWMQRNSAHVERRG